jgi:autotransporter-associated beta strand protein
VQFAVDGINFGAPVRLGGGVAKINDSALSVGSHAVTATYSSDATFSGSGGDLSGGQTVTTVPTLSAAVVQKGLTERSYVDQLTFQFNKPVTASTAVPMTLTDFGTQGNLNQPVTLPPTQFKWTTVPGTGASVLTWSLDSFAGGTSSLPDGYYQLTLPSAAIADQYGIPLGGTGVGQGGSDYTADFFVLGGDVTGDGVVNSADMDAVDAVLGSRPGSSNWNPNADLNRSGTVTTSDRIIVYENMGHSITPPAGPGVRTALAAVLPAWVFDTSMQTTTNELPAGSPVNGITFNADAGASVLNGNAVELSGNILNQSPNTQTINLPLTLIGSQTIDTAAGNVVIVGDIGQSGGGFGITKTGIGTAVLSGVNTYSGATAVNQGTLIVTNASALPAGTSLVVGAGGILLFDPSQAAASASVVRAAAAALAPASGDATLPTSLPENDPTATAASMNSAATVSGTAGTASWMVRPQSAVPVTPLLAVRNNRFAVSHNSVCGPVPLPAASLPQAHDAVLQSLNMPVAAAATDAAALWGWDSSWSNGPSDRKHDSSDRAVDAVMAMLGRTST